MYKFLHNFDGELRSDSGDCTWQIGEWQELPGDPVLCRYGFHCSEKPLDALKYVAGSVLAMVEVGGVSATGIDKSCWQRMRIVQAWRWDEKDNARLAIFAAEQVLPIFEKEYPEDPRPRKAIEAAKEYVLASAAARDAARDAMFDKINGWMEAHIAELTPLSLSIEVVE